MTAEPDETPALRGTDIRLVPLAVSAWGGCLAGLASSTAGALLPIFGVLAVIGAVFLFGRGRAPLILIGLCALVAFSAAILGHLSVAKLRQSPPAQVPDGSEVSVSGTVSGELNPQSTSWGSNSWSVQVSPVSGGRITAMVNTEAMKGAPLIRGSVVQLEGKLDKPEDLTLPSLGYLRVSSATVLSPAPPWQRWVASLKSRLGALATQKAGAVGPLIVGMAIGDDRGLDKPLKDAMLTTSLTHLSAVSGSHIALTLTLLGALMPGRRKAKVVSTLLFLVLVVVVVGPQPSVVRAVGMGGLASWGLLMHRGGQPLALLSTVTIATVFISPWSAVSIGFALSTLATAGILTVGRFWVRAAWVPLSETELISDSRAGPLVKSLVEAVAIAVAAHLFTLPALALINPWLPTWGVVANLAVAPVVAPITMLGLGAAVTCMWAPRLAGLLITAAVPFARFMESAALTVASWPVAQMPWPQGVGGAVLVGTVTAATAVPATIATSALLKDRRP